LSPLSPPLPQYNFRFHAGRLYFSLTNFLVGFGKAEEKNFPGNSQGKIAFLSFNRSSFGKASRGSQKLTTCENQNSPKEKESLVQKGKKKCEERRKVCLRISPVFMLRLISPPIAAQKAGKES
jgi:hypothetical protein